MLLGELRRENDFRIPACRAGVSGESPGGATLTTVQRTMFFLRNASMASLRMAAPSASDRRSFT